jgi:hypothetical protein
MNGKQHYLGAFASPEHAALEYEKKRVMYTANLRTNFPADGFRGYHGQIAKQAR